MTRPRPERQIIDPAEATRLRDEEEWTLPRIAAHFGVTRQAVAAAIRKYKEQKEIEITRGQLNPKGGAWPWIIAKEHLTGDTQYRRFLALRKQREGRPVNPTDAKLAQETLMFISRGNLAITYHRDLGFTFTNRLPEDGDDIFVARPPEWWAQLGYAA